MTLLPKRWAMRDRTFYLWVVVPALLWSVLSIAYSAWLQGLPTDRAPTSVESLALWVGSWSVRLMPFAVLAAFALAPLFTLAAAGVMEPISDAGALRRRVFAWLAVSLVSMGATVPLVMSDSSAMMRLALPLLVSFSASTALGLALGCRAQALLKASGVSRLGDWPMVILSMALQFFVLPAAWALAIVAAVRARRHQVAVVARGA